MTSDSKPAPFGLGSWTDVAWLVSISSTLLLALLPFSSYIASIPFLGDEWGMSNSQAAAVFSAYLVGYAVSAAFLIPVTDRLPAGRVMFASVALIAVSNILFPLLARDVWTASALRFVAGAGHVGAYIPGIRIVSLRFADGMRGTAVAIFVGAGYAGTTISYVFMGTASEPHGFVADGVHDYRAGRADRRADRADTPIAAPVAGGRIHAIVEQFGQAESGCAAPPSHAAYQYWPTPCTRRSCISRVCGFLCCWRPLSFTAEKSRVRLRSWPPPGLASCS